MARQELSNVFQDGLMMDLNPINTPKSVLTDCLNGTYITYNGNEFVLQNDMGNYKLKNCKLPTNFIPVGVKGYGDILYIVSYNPITNETEIGSYPAPQSIFTTGETEDALEATPDQLAPFIWGPETNIKDTEVEYPTIIRTNKKPIFIFAGTDKETYKLNPGDEFRFSGKVDIPAFIYQHLNFYIIDEDNKLYDIDDTQIYEENGELVSPDLRKVFWETPGWLAAQYDLYVPDKFNLNLRSLNVPEFLVAQSDDGTFSQAEEPLDEQIPQTGQFKVSMDLSSQTIITDKLFQNELNKNFGNINNPNLNTPWGINPANVYDHLYIRYLIKQNQNPPKEGEDDYGTFKGIVVSIDDTHTKDYTNGVAEGDYVYYDIPVWKHNYQDDIITAYNNIKPIWFCNNPDKNKETGDLDIANYHGVVELTAYPIIKYNKLTLKYTQFSTTQRFPLNTLKNSSDINIADSIYKWSVDDNSCTISFNVNGPFINVDNITGKYEIRRINFLNFDETGTLIKPERNENVLHDIIPNLILYGQNTINIEWDENSNFKKEGGIYELKIILKQDNSTEPLSEKSIILIPSSVFNNYFGTYDNYLDSITYPMWVGKYLDYVNLSNVVINNLSIDFSKYKDAEGIEHTPSILNDGWLQYKWNDEPGDYKNLNYTNVYNDTKNDLIIEQSSPIQLIYALYAKKFSDYFTWSINDGENVCAWQGISRNITSYLLLKLNFEKLGHIFEINENISVDLLKGDLWNPKYETIISFKQDLNDPIFSISQLNDEEWKLDAASLTQDVRIDTTTQLLHDVITKKNEFLPYLKPYAEYNAYHRWLRTEKYIYDRVFKNIQVYYSRDTEGHESQKVGRTDARGDRKISINDSSNTIVKEYENMVTAGYIPIDLNVWNGAGGAGDNWAYATSNANGGTNQRGTLLAYENHDYKNRLIVMRSSHAIATKMAPCVIDFPANEFTNYMCALAKICVRNANTTPETFYIPQITLSNLLLENIQYVFNKINSKISILSLAVDNQYLLIPNQIESGMCSNLNTFNKLKSLDSDGLGIDTGELFNSQEILFNSVKEIFNYNLNPNISVNLNYINCEPYQTFINNLSYFINRNHIAVDTFLKEGSEFKDIHFYTEEEKDEYKVIIDKQYRAYGINTDLVYNWEFGNIDTDNLLNKFTAKIPGREYSDSNIGFYTSTNQVLKACLVGNQNSDISPYPSIEVAYYNIYSLNDSSSS